jgi:hypothetical protein
MTKNNPTSAATEGKLWRWLMPVLWLVIAAFVIVFISFGLCKWTGENADEAKRVAKQAEQAKILLGQLCSSPGSCESAIMYQGPVKKEPMARLLAQLDATKITWLCLNSGGGDSEVGISFAKEIRRRNISTCVAPATVGDGPYITTACISACSKIWLNGKQRILARENAEVGFHPDYVGVGKCCQLPNLLIRWMYMLQPYFEDGDEDARRQLREKAADYDAFMYYKLHTQEAEKLHLVTSEDAAKSWYWHMD